MIDGERRGFAAGYEAVAPIVEEARQAGQPVRMPTDEELGRLAADAWIELQSRGYAHIEPKEVFLRGYAQACRGLLALFTQEEVTP